MTYAEKLKSPKWQRRRLEILERDKFKCKKCGDTETTLHVHHLSYHGEPWEAQDSELDTLCEDCHKLITILEKDEELLFNYHNTPIAKIEFDSGNTIFFSAMLDGDLYIQVVIEGDKHAFQIMDRSSVLSIRKILNKALANEKDHAE